MSRTLSLHPDPTQQLSPVLARGYGVAGVGTTVRSTRSTIARKVNFGMAGATSAMQISSGASIRIFVADRAYPCTKVWVM